MPDNNGTPDFQGDSGQSIVNTDDGMDLNTAGFVANYWGLRKKTGQKTLTMNEISDVTGTLKKYADAGKSGEKTEG